MRAAAGADRDELVTRGELYCALWIQAVSVAAYMEPFGVRLNGATRCSG